MVLVVVCNFLLGVSGSRCGLKQRCGGRSSGIGRGRGRGIVLHFSEFLFDSFEHGIEMAVDGDIELGRVSSRARERERQTERDAKKMRKGMRVDE